MRLFLNLYNNISSFNTWEFICFTMEHISFSIRSSLINLNFENFLFFCNLLSITILTFIFLIDLFSLSTAFVAWSCSLTIHSWPKHLHNGSHSFTIATFACLDSSSFTSLSIAFTTNSISINYNFSSFSIK